MEVLRQEQFVQQQGTRFQEPLEWSTQQPNFIVPLQNLEGLVEGQSGHFEAQVTPMGDPTMRVEWYINGVPLKASSRVTSFFSFGYVALDIKDVYTQDAGVYSCKAINALGEAITSANLQPPISRNAVQKSLEAQTPLMDRINELEELSRQRYIREYWSEDDHKQRPDFRTHLPSFLELTEGQRAHLEANLSPTGDPSMKVYWFKDGQPLVASSRATTTYDFGFVTLEINPVFIEDDGEYICKAVNNKGEASSSTTITVRGEKGVQSESLFPQGLEKIQLLEDPSRYSRDTWVEDVGTNQAPVFTVQLQDVTDLNEGDNAHLEACLEPRNDPSLKVEWFVNGKPLITGHKYRPHFDFGYVALNMISVNPEESGIYTCRASNNLGQATTQATLKIRAKKSIVLESQHPEGLEKIQKLEDWDTRYAREEVGDEYPQQVPVFIAKLQSQENLKEGQNVHLECQLQPVGDPTMKVEWFFNENPLMQGHRFRTTYDFSYVALDILTVYPEDSGTYSVRAKNALGETTSSAKVKVAAKYCIDLETHNPEGLRTMEEFEELSKQTQGYDYDDTHRPLHVPVFTTEMLTQTLPEGANALFQCELLPNNDPTLEVTWYYNKKPLKKGHRFKTSHEFTHVTLDILTVYPEDSGEYTIRAKNALGEAWIGVNLHVEGKTGVVTETQNPSGMQKIQEMEGNKYVPPEMEETTLTQEPVFTSQPTSQNLNEGQNARFECQLQPAGDPTLTVKWFHNGEPVMHGHRYRDIHEFSHVSLEILGIYPEDSGEYAVQAVNGLGEAWSRCFLQVAGKKAVVTESQNPGGMQKIQELESNAGYVKEYYQEEEGPKHAPTFLMHLTNFLELMEGESLHLECILQPYNDSTLKVEWLCNGKSIPQGHRFRTEMDFGQVKLDILGVYPEDSGEYIVRATNSIGTAETKAKIKVKAKVSINRETQHPYGLEKIQSLEDPSRYIRDVYIDEKPKERPRFTLPLYNFDQVEEGSDVQLECHLLPIGDPTLKVEWYKNGKPLNYGHRFKPAHDFDCVSLLILSVYKEDNGIYTSRAINSKGEDVTSAFVRCKVTPPIQQ